MLLRDGEMNILKYKGPLASFAYKPLTYIESNI